MPIFVALCLILAVLVQIGNPVQALLVSTPVLYGGLIVAITTIAASFFKRIPESISYDIFACSALFIWFSYWKPLFVSDSPIFFFFPVYFALVVAFATLFFIGQRHRIDKESRKLMQGIVNSGVIDPWILMACVLVTLYFENRFIQFPTFMTLLVMRYTLSSCLKPSQADNI
jgi:hypothetical protein